jgi:hypothetical protein
VNGRGAADGVRSDFGQPDVTNITSLHHLGDRPDRVFDRHGRIEPRGAIDVDVVGAKPAQRRGKEVLHRGRPCIIAQPIPGHIAQGAELDADHDTVAVTADKRLADQHLVVAHAVEIAGVEQCYPGIESGMDGGDALAAVGGAIEVGHAHAAEADDRNFGPRWSMTDTP